MRAVLILTTLLAAQAGAAQFKPLVQGGLRGAFAAVEGGSSAGQVLGDLMLAPALKLDNGLLINPLAYLNATGQSRPLEEDVLFVRTVLGGVRPTLSWNLRPGYQLSLRAEAKRAWNQESFGERFGAGYYDYEEFGGGLSLGRSEGPLSSSLSLDRAYRGYPNNRKPGASLTQDKNYYVKDAWSWRVGLRHRDQLSPAAVMTASLRLYIKEHTDAYVTKLDGQLDLGQLQSDLGGSADLGGSLKLDEAWMATLGAGMDINDSNQNAFDIAANRFSPGVQDYLQWRLSPGLRWAQGRWGAGLAYQLALRNTAKPIQTPQGAYTQGLQADVEHGVDLDGSWAWMPGLRLSAYASGRRVFSNQELLRGARSDYAYLSAGLGLSWDWEGK